MPKWIRIRKGFVPLDGLTSSSGDGGSGMGMSRGAWSDDMSVILKASSWKHTDTVKGYRTLCSNHRRSRDGRRLTAFPHVTKVEPKDPPGYERWWRHLEPESVNNAIENRVPLRIKWESSSAVDQINTKLIHICQCDKMTEIDWENFLVDVYFEF